MRLMCKFLFVICWYLVYNNLEKVVVKDISRNDKDTEQQSEIRLDK
ncbi:MAG: hypothetical protein LBO67_07345 [Spirochaetaceae bacterium]|nr:hypothetical protein [Spirochaetaceae bacterium]